MIVGALPTSTTVPAAGAPAAPAPVHEERERSLLEGISLENPFEIPSTFAANVISRMTGVYEPRYGDAAVHGVLAGERIVTATLRSVGSGSGIIASASRTLARVLPMLNIGIGGIQIFDAWKDSVPEDRSVAGMIANKQARSGALQIAAGAMLFVPGVGGALAGAALMAASMANDLDMFSSLDRPA